MNQVFSSNRMRPFCIQTKVSPKVSMQSSQSFTSQSFISDVFGAPAFGQEPVKRYKGNTPHMFDLAVTGMFGALSGVGFLISATNPFIGIPLLAVGGFGAVRQVMHNFVHRVVKAGMA